MSGILISILVISAVRFIISFFQLMLSEHGEASIPCGAILTIILWKPVFVLGLLSLIFTALALIIGVIKIYDK